MAAFTCISAVPDIVLAGHLNQARDILVQGDAFQTWFKANSIDGNFQISGLRKGDLSHQWFELIALLPAYRESGSARFGLEFASGWLRNDDRPHFSTATLGWLLAGKPDQAAADINKEPRDSARHIDSTWLQGIFQASWTELQLHPAYHAAWKVEEKLWESLRKIEAKLDEVLQDIRDQYEGGEPRI